MGKIDTEKRDARFKALGLPSNRKALTEKVLEAVRTHPQGERYSLADGTVPGLELQVAPTGAASFLLHYRLKKDGTRRHLGIAAAGALPLDEVRAIARERLVDVGRGGDPAEEKRQARAAAEREKASTVRAYLANVYGPNVLAHRKAGGKPKDEDSKPTDTWGRILFTWKPLLDHQLGGLTREAIEKVLADRKAAGAAMGSLLREWGAFRAMLADAVDRGQLAALPMTRRPIPIRGESGNARVRWLGQFDKEEEIASGKGERNRFEDALAAFTSREPAGGDFLRFAARIALSTGMRRGEIVRLRDSWINLREGTITLPKENTKSKKSRVVYLNATSRAALDGWRLRGTHGEFCAGNPKNWEDRLTQREWPALCSAAGITDLHFHDARHDYAVRLLKSGATLAQVRDALGHASITQTERYAHVAPSDVRKAVLAMVPG